jgi:hypothetical protein
VWELGGLTERLGVTEGLVKQGLELWIGEGVIRDEGGGKWRLMEVADDL